MREPNAIAADLVATGLTAGQMALLLELTISLSSDHVRRNPVESPEQVAAERRRAYDRERKRRKRLAVVEGGAENRAEIPADKAENHCLLEEEVRGLAKVSLVKKESKKGIRMREGTPLSDEDRAFAETLLDPSEVPQAWVEFVDYWSAIPGSRGVKLSWKSTWRNRVRDIIKYRGSKRGNGAGSNRANSFAGRATANEAAFLTSMGKGALGRLEANRAARSDGEIPDGPGAPGFDAFRQRAKAGG